MKYGEVPYFAKPLSRIVLGSVPFSSKSLDNTFELIDTFLAAGGNTIDFAHGYGGGDGHRAMAAYLKERNNRDEFVLFDKGCHHHGQVRRVTEDAISNDLLQNLDRLGLPFTEFFVLHRDDQLVPAGNIVQWLNTHKDAGRIKVFGGSNFHHSRIIQANAFAEENGLQGFSASSSHLSLASPNAPMWDDCVWVDQVARNWYQETQFPLFSWSSAGGGFFAGFDSPDIRRVYHNSINFARLERVKEFAKKKGVAEQAISLAWTLNQPLNIFALIGPTNKEQLESSLVAADIVLDPGELAYLEHGRSK